jgi:hypothetical protein
VGEAVGVAVSVGDADGAGVSLGSGVGDDFFLCFGDAEGDSSSAGVGEAFFFFRGEAVGEGVGDFLAFFFRCDVGVGVGVEKISLSFSPTLCAGAGVTKDTARMAAIRRVIGLRRDFLQHRFVNANAGIKIFEREIFVGRMRAAIGQRQAKEQCFDT